MLAMFLSFYLIFNLDIANKKLGIFVNKFPVTLFQLHLKKYHKIRYKERVFDHLRPLLAYYIFLRELYKLKA